MNIELKDVVTLSNDISYVVAGKTIYNSKTYFLMVNMNNISDFKIFYLDNEDMVVSKDEDINNNLLPLFFESARSDVDIANTLKEFIEE